MTAIRTLVGLAAAIAATIAAAADVPNVSPNQVAPPALPGGGVAQGPGGVSVYARAARSVVLVVCVAKDGDKTVQGIGAGSVLDDKGLVLTNVHVVEGKSRCFAMLKPAGYGAITKDTPSYPLNVIAMDPTKDLALAMFVSPPPGLQALPLGSMKDVDIGQEVHAIGHPLGKFWTYSKGVVSQIRLKESGVPPLVADTIQTQTPISPGNSGGPLLVDSGKLVGVNTYVSTQGQNLNFSVAVNEVEEFIKRVAAGQHRVVADGRDAGGTGSAGAGEAARSPEAKAGACDGKPKALGEAPSRGNPGKIVSLDIGCTGSANARLFLPADPAKERILYISTARPEPGAERYFDKRYYIDPASGKILRSWHDVDRDGKPDFIGVHRNGEDEPSEFIAFNATAQ